MQVSEFYNQRKKYAEEQLLSLRKRSSNLVKIRVVSFLLALVLFYMLVAVSLWIAIAVAVSLLAVFITVILKDQQNKKHIRYFELLQKINEDELRFLDNEFLHFESGGEFIHPTHDFSYDLDVFGKASLFQYINRTLSPSGKKKLSDLFLHFESKAEVITERQKAVQELKEMPEWLQEFRVAGHMEMPDSTSAGKISRWLKEPTIFTNRKFIRFIKFVLPALNLLLLILSFFFLPVGYLALTLIFSFLFNYYEMRNVNKVHRGITGTEDELQGLSSLLKKVEEKEFKTKILKNLKSQTETEGRRASEIIYELSKLSKRLDYRLNIYIAIPLNLFLLWDINHAVLIENWKKKHRQKVDEWFATIGEIEAMISLGQLSFNKPEWIFPQVRDEFFTLEAEEMGHPLIPADQRVNNDFSLKGKGKFALVTGSNMSGKTTFLRTIGVNLLLARMGAPVCAKKFVFSPVKIYSSMRISDSLAENTSSFYAELKRLKNILDKVRQKEKAVLLLDEILKGTNSRDRHIGSEALLKQLVKNEAAGLLATHDLELSGLEKELPQNISNYNFDVQISGSELYFDYKIHQGICKSMNATILMQKIGIELEP